MTLSTQSVQSKPPTWTSYLPNAPSLDLQATTRKLQTVAVPLVTLAALSSLPTADGWWGANPRVFVECFDKCDKVSEDLIRLACYTMCWIITQ